MSTFNDFNNMSFDSIASIDMIIGPMYAGKTTELLRRLSIYKEMGLRCCYINSDKDNRSSGSFSTHNKVLQNTKRLDDEFDAYKMPQDLTQLIELHMNMMYLVLMRLKCSQIYYLLYLNW